ncbi:MAG: hypothetical protein EZS26_002237 [Candidatus Ordinivivax streblomastigis]|uniref:Uncharacterized protein n=1 Tax=Candidatus Ordinivivax streblomastigis TaxID=2540710 RepID=A0A5M8NZQ7_9BACT|nr:MAG: hypothetical protein EZS26_002237 [Candidatus Ordinivivax streblomastigis]
MQTSTTLNPIQLHLLQMFQYMKDEQSLNELQEVLRKYYQAKSDEEVEKVWQEKNMDNEMMHELVNAHYRTPYK